MQTRADFLATAGMIAALRPTPAPTPTPTSRPASEAVDSLPRGFTMGSFNAALTTKAKHKHLFAGISDGGEVTTAVRSTLNSYRAVGVAASDVAPQVVFYHGPAVLFGFDDQIWLRYVIPTKTVPASAGKSKLNGNPLLVRQPGEWDNSIPALVESANAHFFVCNLATWRYVTRVSKQLNIEAEDLYEELAAHLVPNGMLVPAGVWAINAIQERDYTLLQYS